MGKLGIIITAGGSGTRMGGGAENSAATTISTTPPLPKQFLLLGGKPVLAHCVEAFRAVAHEAEIVVALPAGHFETWAELCREHKIPPHKTCRGGATRTESVRNAIAELGPDCEFIAVHDGARPLVSPELILRAIETAHLHGSAIPVVPLVDSIRRLDAKEGAANDNAEGAQKRGDEGLAGISHPEDRNGLVAVQTPQVFRADILREAYEDASERADIQHFTDEATVVEAVGYNVVLCYGERRNIKITEPDDLRIAQAIFKTKN